MMRLSLRRAAHFCGYAAAFVMIQVFLQSEAPFFAFTPPFLIERSHHDYAFWIVACGLLVTGLLPTEIERPSDLLLHLQYLFPILPMLAIYWHYELPWDYMLAVIVAFVLVVVVANSSRFGLVHQGLVEMKTIAGFSLGIAATVMVLTIAMGGLRYFNLNVWEVYEYRQAASDNLPGFFGYLNHLVTKVLLPAAAVFGWHLRKYYLALIAVLGGILFFGLTAHKAVLFYPVIALLTYVFARTKVGYIIFGYFSIILLSLLAMDNGIIGLAILVVDRLLLIAAEINFMFFDWFSNANNPLVLWSDSKVSMGLLQYPYDLDVPFLIGREYFGDEMIGANTGWLGAAYANAGFAGMFIYAGALAFLLAVLNFFARVHGTAVALGLGISPFFALMTSADLPNSLLTHGLLLMLVIIGIAKPCSQLGAGSIRYHSS